ncbi:MAG: hypothetical protein K2R98_20230 [Gemmataceae bacterium]|nr:hypothetical protein [Gemmataceae bacterium]
MSARLDRREFVQHGAATLILGYPFVQLFGADKPSPASGPPQADDLKQLKELMQVPKPGELIALARQRMKDEVKLGVVIVVPADASNASMLANQLSLLIGAADPKCCVSEPRRPFGFPPAVGPGDAAAQLLFYQAVFVCLPVDEVKDLVSDLKADTAVVLLDLAGKPAAELKSEPELFTKGFAKHMAEFIEGKQAERLGEVIKAQRAAVGKETAERIDQALRDLDAREFDKRQRAGEYLTQMTPRCTAILMQALRGKPSLEVTRRLEKMFESVYLSQEKPGARLPFGVAWQEQVVDACPGCGRGEASHSSRRFLRFTSQPRTKK